MPPTKRRQQKKNPPDVADYQHTGETRLNNPPAGLADICPVPMGRKTYAYDPRLDPQLQWAGKDEHTTFDIETVPMYIHDRISPIAIINRLRTAPVQRNLFGDPEFDFNQAVEFYQHDMQWVNRLMLGDSLLVMNSLLERELMAGKVQCIYFDPPYGIKYGSNFQPFTNKRDVKDGADDSLTREPEQIKAFRDTWELGVHSYLTYLRDRLLLCRELLTESGSIFVQISDENVHRVRCILDEVFGAENFVSLVTVRKTGGLGSEGLTSVADYIIWYAKDKQQIRYHQLFLDKAGDGFSEQYRYVQFSNGSTRTLKAREILPKEARAFQPTSLHTMYAGVASCIYEFESNGKNFKLPSNRQWSTTYPNMMRVAASGRIYTQGNTPRFIRYIDDFPVNEITNIWSDVMGTEEKMYVVQTSNTVIQRCILMTTDPGDIVLDPTCGSGTTAYVAEQWGRRWITCDTSRVALALARQRLLTASYPYYKLADSEQGVREGFIYKTVPHVTLKDIANNEEIDTIHARWQERMEPVREQLNTLLNQSWEEWQIPREAETKWTDEARTLHGDWWRMRQERQQAIDASIARNAAQETLYDQPEVDRSIVRVSGPFTVEAVQPPTVDPFAVDITPPTDIVNEGKLYLERMIEQLRRSGITMRGQHIAITHIAPLANNVLHAECSYTWEDKTHNAAIVFGPQYGPLTSVQLYDALDEARGTYDTLIAAAFTFDASAQAALQKEKLRPAVLSIIINADVLTNDLLKTSQTSQVFSMFGRPDVILYKHSADEYTVEICGMDVYDPATNEVMSSNAEDSLAAWFLDTDYNGQTFLVCHAYFPVQVPNPWEKLGKALRGTIDEERIADLQRTTSLPFKAGHYGTCAVKSIDLRGNEAMCVLKLDEGLEVGEASSLMPLETSVRGRTF